MPANFLTLIRQNVEEIGDWSAITDLVGAENIIKHDRDVDLRGLDGGGELAGRVVDIRISQRGFSVDSSSSWRFSLRFTVTVKAERLPIGKLEEIELLILCGATYLNFGKVPGTSDDLGDVSPAIVDEYVVADFDPELDLVGGIDDGWESVCAIVVNGTVPFSELMS